MKYGLTNEDFELLNRLVITPLKQKNVRIFIFGSRARGKHHRFSDLDLLIEPAHPHSLEDIELSLIKESIEESRFPLKVDFVINHQLAESYRAQVDSEKIEL